MKALTDATLRVRDAIYVGLLVRRDEVLTEAVARERANNISVAVIETIREGLVAEMQRKAEEQPPPVRVHQAMQDAPHDGQLFRQARAAIEAVRNPGDVEDEPAGRYFFDEGEKR